MSQWMLSRLAAAFLVALVLPGAASADVLAELRRGGGMLWGGDQEGGGPYVFPREDNPAQVTGFEVDLANRLGEYLKVRAMFTGCPTCCAPARYTPFSTGTSSLPNAPK